MASFGAKYPYFAKIKAETDAALPTYTGGTRIGQLVKADLTVTLSTGELFADDGLAEKVEEFSSATIAMETDDMTDAVAALLFGATLDEQGGELKYSASDAQPMGGLGYYKVLMRNGSKVYKAYFYPKVKAALGNDSAATKGNSITFGTTPINFTVYQPQFGGWRHTKEFTGDGAEASAKSYIEGKMAEVQNPPAGS